MNKPKVSIITPTYNVEKYIERCAVSLFEQDFEDIEYIFVNDCTPDNSVEILEKIIEKYPNRKPNVKIIHHEENKGSGASRKTGIESATGEYTIQIDSDDWCELNMISSLYNKAKETDADIVASDMIVELKNKTEYLSQPYTDKKEDNIAKILCQVIIPSLANKLIKRSLYTDNHILPDEKISYSEDKFIVVRAYLFAKKMTYIPTAFYHYDKRQTEGGSSLTINATDKVWNDLKVYLNSMRDFLEENNVWDKYRDFLYMDILYETIYYSQKPTIKSKNIRKNIMKIEPNVSKIKYIWKHPLLKKELSLKQKMKLTLIMLNLEMFIPLLKICTIFDIVYKKIKK